jgi:hypothetical protein
MHQHRIPTYYSIITALLSLAIYTLQLLGKISTLAAIVAGVLTMTKVLLDLRAAHSDQTSPSGTPRTMPYALTLPSFAPVRSHHDPRCACPSCYGFDHDLTIPMLPLRAGGLHLSTVDTETSEPWLYTSHQGHTGPYLLKTLEAPRQAQVRPFSLARLLS